MKKADILALLEAHRTPFPEEEAFRQQVLEFVARHADFWQRSNLVGHITGSAWVLGPDEGSVLLVHHRKLDRWLQPGGHVDEGDPTVADTARREVAEECGLADLSLISTAIFDVDVHEIPARGQEPTHLHLDLRFLFRADNAVLNPDFSEVKNLRWVPLAELVGEGTGQSIRRMALKCLTGVAPLLDDSILF